MLIRQSKGNKDKLKRKILYLFNSKFMSHKFQDGTKNKVSLLKENI